MRGPKDPGMTKKMKEGEGGIKMDKHVRGLEDPGMCKKMKVGEGPIQVDKPRKELESSGMVRKMKAGERGCNLRRILISTRTLPQVVPSSVSSLSKSKGLAINS